MSKGEIVGQITLDQWLQTKQRLQAELLGVRKSFVRIGYLLRQVEESEGYKMDGYDTVAEWAKGEYGIEASTTSRFISINKEYSVGGYSEELLPEYEDFKRSQLEEMLKLPAADRAMITPDTPRADIRELKAFNKTKVEGVADDIKDFLEKFIEDNMQTAKEMKEKAGDTEAMKEAMIPSGNKSYRKGIFFMMANEKKVSIKKFGGTPVDYEWQQFRQIMGDIFEERADLCNTEIPEKIAPAQFVLENQVEEQEKGGNDEGQKDQNEGTQGPNQDAEEEAEGESGQCSSAEAPESEAAGAGEPERAAVDDGTGEDQGSNPGYQDFEGDAEGSTGEPEDDNNGGPDKAEDGTAKNDDGNKEEVNDEKPLGKKEEALGGEDLPEVQKGKTENPQGQKADILRENAESPDPEGQSKEDNGGKVSVDDQLPGQMEVQDYPELMPEGSEIASAMNPPVMNPEDIEVLPPEKTSKRKEIKKAWGVGLGVKDREGMDDEEKLKSYETSVGLIADDLVNAAEERNYKAARSCIERLTSLIAKMEEISERD